MKNPDITPGEWGYSTVYGEESLAVIGDTDSYGDAPVVCRVEYGSAQKANARAIAALPDLLEALEGCLSMLNEYRQTGHMTGWDKPYADGHKALIKAGYTFD